MKVKIAKIVVGLPIDASFDYLVPEKLLNKIKIGSRVWVSFGSRRLVGYVVGFSSESKFKKIKPVLSLIDNQPILEKKYLDFLKEFSQYYFCSLGEAIEASLPPGLKKGEKIFLKESKLLEKIKSFKDKPSNVLIQDISFSKRWDIFFKKIKNNLDLNAGTIFLVPEVENIIPAYQRLKDFLPKEDIAVLNRRQSPNNQLAEWQKVKNGLSSIAIGTRSAVFAPLKNLKLIIIDEEDNASYKQEQSPFYHAREVALMRIKADKANLILASAAPSLEAYQLAKKNKFECITLSEEKKPAEVQVVDMNRFSFGERRKNTVIAFPLEDNIRKTIAEGGKIILFINRKGFSNIIRCRKCKFTLKCKRCNVSLTYHFDKKKLICRFCNYKIDPPQLCPQCNDSYMRYSVMGTEKLESEVSRIFPDKKILRLDKEARVRNDKFDILIATQMILKSYSLISVDLVGVVGIDNALNRLDFRAAEKTFSLLVKLSLLANKKIIIQTHCPKHYSIFSAAQRNFPYFYKQELKYRRSLEFPPFGHFISVMLRGKKLEAVKSAVFILFEKLNQLNKTKKVEIFEPLPDIPDKLRGAYRWHILLKAKVVKQMNKLIKDSLRNMGRKSGIIISINVDI